MLVFAVDTHLLFQVVYVSLAAGVGVSVLFSFVIVGAGRAGEARRAGRTGLAAFYVAVAVLTFLAFCAGVGLGVQAMVTK